MKEAKLIAASWGRSFAAALIACYLAGVTDPDGFTSRRRGGSLARHIAVLKSWGCSIRAY
jgi:hypothetical protein